MSILDPNIFGILWYNRFTYWLKMFLPFVCMSNCGNRIRLLPNLCFDIKKFRTTQTPNLFLSLFNTHRHYSLYQSILLKPQSLIVRPPLEQYSHFSSLALCLQQGAKNRNKRLQLRGLTFRELTFNSLERQEMMKVPCFPSTVTRESFKRKANEALGHIKVPALVFRPALLKFSYGDFFSLSIKLKQSEKAM